MNDTCCGTTTSTQTFLDEISSKIKSTQRNLDELFKRMEGMEVRFKGSKLSKEPIGKPEETQLKSSIIYNDVTKLYQTIDEMHVIMSELEKIL